MGITCKAKCTLWTKWKLNTRATRVAHLAWVAIAKPRKYYAHRTRTKSTFRRLIWACPFCLSDTTWNKRRASSRHTQTPSQSPYKNIHTAYTSIQHIYTTVSPPQVERISNSMRQSNIIGIMICYFRTKNTPYVWWVVDILYWYSIYERRETRWA